MALLQIWPYLIVEAGYVNSVRLLSSFLMPELLSAGPEVAVGRGTKTQCGGAGHTRMDRSPHQLSFPLIIMSRVSSRSSTLHPRIEHTPGPEVGEAKSGPEAKSGSLTDPDAASSK